MPRVTNNGSTSTVELGDDELPGGKQAKAASATLDHISDITVKPAHNGGFVITVSKKSKPTRSYPSYQEPETYALEDGEGLVQFFTGLVGGDTAKDAASGGGEKKAAANDSSADDGSAGDDDTSGDKGGGESEAAADTDAADDEGDGADDAGDDSDKD